MAVEKEDIIRSLYQAIATLANMPGKSDIYIPKHQHSISHISALIAQILGVDNDAINGVRIAGTLHDCGLMTAPDHILTKPGQLSPEEFAVIKAHPGLGAEILKATDFAFPWPVAEIVFQHHEFMDGSGYPRGLKGDEILREAQIIAVSDAIDAMLNDRPYRKALTVAAALDELKKCRATRYDPAVVDACVELYTKQTYRLNVE